MDLKINIMSLNHSQADYPSPIFVNGMGRVNARTTHKNQVARNFESARKRRDIDRRERTLN